MSILKGIAQVGTMRRMKAKDYPFVPDISPGIQGVSAWKLLKPQQLGQVNAALDDAAKQYKCHRKDLQWRTDKYGAIHIRKRPIIEIPRRVMEA